MRPSSLKLIKRRAERKCRRRELIEAKRRKEMEAKQAAELADKMLDTAGKLRE